MKGNTNVRIPRELIEKAKSDLIKAINSGEDNWDEETRKDWEEKMNSYNRPQQ